MPTGATTNGTEDFWFNGLPYEGLRKATAWVDEGIESYWFAGLSGESIYPTEAQPPPAPARRIFPGITR
jgi:hypothetical protein